VSSFNDSFSVICLCAEWCGTCRAYRSTFTQVGARFPGARFHWLDIEDQADQLGDIDIENFPTLLISRGNAILYFGVMLPPPEHLARILDNFQAQDGRESLAYAQADPLRRAWQQDPDLQNLLRYLAP
jgi:thioredoxin 1